MSGLKKSSTPSPLASARYRVFFIGFLVVAAVFTLVHRLFVIQVYEGEKYTESLRNQTTVSILLPPARGSIMDRNGIALAENRASFDIDVYLRELIGHYSRSHRGRLPKANVPIGTGKNRRTRKQVDAAKIVNESAAELFKTLDLEKNFDDIDIQRHYYQTPNIPFQIANNIDFNTLSQFAEKNIQIPGIQETARPIRQYPYGAFASHILGYLGKLEEETDADFQPEFIGKAGLERSFDEELQGEPGGKILRKNNLGFILGEEAIVPPTSGDFIYTTLDARIQWIAEMAMKDVGRGAVIVMNPKNGDILAMVSVPNFDPNEFIPKVTPQTWKSLTQDPTEPLFNRAISAYAAGSIYKPLIALAALENKNIDFTPNTIIHSPGAIWMANRWWRDWSPNGQGSISLRKAMAMSCNTFFYQLGARTGIESIVAMGERLGLGKKLLNTTDREILRGEDPGVLPGPEWMDARGEKKLQAWRERRKKTGKKLRAPIIEKWSVGHTLNTSIGQGYVEVTPIQMAVMMSSIANGGNVYYPRLVMGVSKVTEDGEFESAKEYPVRLRNELNMTPANLKAVQDSLRAVVQEGTGRRAAVKDEDGKEVENFPAAGKTGTAQFTTTLQGKRVKDLRAWFNGFAPYNDPRYVVTVVVEGGRGGGSTAGPIASEIFTGIHKMEQGEEVEMLYLAPTIGHFSGVKTRSDETLPEHQPSLESLRGLHRSGRR